MGIYRVCTGNDGESHLEALRVEEHPALGALTHIHEVRVQQCDGTRRMAFHPLPERRLIIHLSGEVEIGTRDGSRHVFRAGDMRLMEDVTGRGHTHVDRSPSAAVSILLKDEDGRAHVVTIARGAMMPDDDAQAGVAWCLGHFVSTVHWHDLSATVQHDAKRTLVNFFAGALGAARHPDLTALAAVLETFSGPREATVIGRGTRLDVLSAVRRGASSIAVGRSAPLRGWASLCVWT